MSGVIETVRCREGAYPLEHLHRARLARALKTLGWAPREVVLPALDGDGVVRVIVTEGDVDITTRDRAGDDTVSLIIASTVHQPYPIKSTERACFDAADEEAAAAGAEGALLLSEAGHVAEGTIWNVFWWNGDVLCTPSRDVEIFEGIGRGRVLEIAAEQAIFIKADRFGPDAIVGKSVFVTNAVRGVVPVRSLDDQAIETDPRTLQLADRFWSFEDVR